ncbi:DNA polymerase-3 subunit epsilon [Parelusimicrobium proximum]|uniref:3'-5' exonuclease n=1 Tax=Parelusimicrobium proximum TaxID=3228953 RepID=UPI003D186AB6
MDDLFLFSELDNAEFAFLDTETTGLNPAAGAKICEIAIVVSRGREQIDSFSTLINPGTAIPYDASSIHGITNEMVASAPRFADVAPQIISMLSGKIAVCHNADFDIPFIACEMAACGMRLPQVTVLDTLKFARKNGSFKRNNLGNIVTELGLDCSGWHRAMADVKMTEKVFYHFLDKFIASGVSTISELSEYQVKKLAVK